MAELGTTPQRTREYRNHHLDSTRWDGFAARDDDIFITTAYKAGTTWMQGIMAALVFGAQLPARLGDLSPWIDARFMGPIEPLLERVEAQRHRRFIKSHLAADGLRFFPQAKYIVVGRDTRDVFMSLYNHYSAYTDVMYGLFNSADRPGAEFPRCPPTARELWPRWSGQGWFEWEPDGWPFWSHHHHLSTWWEFRGLPNILFVHYADLKADIEAEVRRVATFCEIEIDERSWSAIIASVSLEAMRDDARADGDPRAMAFEGGAARFFFKGENGRWRDVLTDDDLALYETAASSLDPTLRRWLEGGRHAIGA